MRRSIPAGALLVAATLGPLSAHAQELTTTFISRQIQNEESLSLEVRYSAGRAIVSAVDSRTLYSMRLAYDPERTEPVHEYRPGVGVIGAEPTGARSLFRRGFQGAEMELTITNRIPLLLALDLGAVESEIDLGGLRLRGLRIHTGASDGDLRVSSPNPEELALAELRVGAAAFRTEGLGNLNAATIRVEAGVGSVELDLSGLRRAETTLFVKFGVGSVELRIPRDAGIRLQRNVFLTSVSAPGLEPDGEFLVSSNYEGAERRVNIQLEAGLGSIEIVRIDP